MRFRIACSLGYTIFKNGVARLVVYARHTSGIGTGSSHRIGMHTKYTFLKVDIVEHSKMVSRGPTADVWPLLDSC